MSAGKTNAMRMLDKAEVAYQLHSYDPEDGQIHGTAVAQKIGLPPEQVFKTLVAHHGNSLFVFVIPVALELDLKKAAKAAGVKNIEMLPVKDLQKWTGYIRGGCSPVGMKKLYPTYLDSSADEQEKIAVSAGKIGFQLELAPQVLAEQVSAKFVDLTREEG
ncbi:Cys-tRNA(Pro) deacylase [Gorillibacterium timonense]|uniref:Cys-tRNA(Pro) deacylase n=1 Tax=Gorillibacterium timonense TaxID=1689269 RepID=UPI00071D4CAA|nr:Cys-tRNA(Pro) deacylase [Gorillibacterium timonense]